MYLAPDGEEAEIASAAAAFLADALPIARLHQPGSADLGPEQRQALGAMGWYALALPEGLGGSGLTAVEHALFFREAGRQCAPVDVLAQCLAVNLTQDSALRQRLVSGDCGALLAVPDGEEHRLIGSRSAGFAIEVAPDRAAIWHASAFVPEPRPSLDPANSLAPATCHADPLELRQGPQIWQLGQLGTAAMLIGIAEAALDLIVDYASIRETFGRKIGAWQAVRHPCADMAVRLEAARAQLWYAAAALKEGRSDAPAHLDAAKHLAGQVAMANADTSIQLHGGIGVTAEHNCHLLLKHALLLARLFGSKRALLGQLLHARLED